MKEVYIVLTHTGTTLSSIVKFYTKKKYTHVSIGLDSKLDELYSFGRLNPYNPYKGGFVREELNKGTFARFRNTIGAVYELKMTDSEYRTVINTIEYIKQNKDKYKFNILGLFLVSINKKHQRENKFYCAEFVKYVLETALNREVLPKIVKPMDFLELDNIQLVYEGLFKKYKYRDKIEINEIYKSNVTA